jgi:carbon storage regulator CsrA
MLVLTRKTQESVIADTPFGPMLLTVLDIRPGAVRLGFDAPKEIRLLRTEVKKRIDEAEAIVETQTQKEIENVNSH